MRRFSVLPRSAARRLLPLLTSAVIALQIDFAVAREPLAAAASPSKVAAKAAAMSQEEYFAEYVEPVLRKNCYECHSHAAGKAKGGLVLDVRSGWQTGGDSGPAVVPGKPDESLLVQAVRYDGYEMPPRGKLPADEIAKLERWVATGAYDPRVKDSVGRGGPDDDAKRREHWAFQPLKATPVPSVHDQAWPRGNVDRYLLARLEAEHLQSAADADPYTWLRRVTLDLTGVPPTREEIAAFLDSLPPSLRPSGSLSSEPDGETAERRDGGKQIERALAGVVDRLLASPRFGQRWGRHWLDLVGYADQIGTSNDIFAEHAWRYRDWVIAAFNSDRPYDAFIREQLAGDLLPAKSTTERANNLIATGFLLLGDLPIVEADKLKLQADVVDSQVDKIGKAFLGLTLGCARCHDHKFDPISQRDYYGLGGILNSTASMTKAQWGIWSWPTVVELPESENEGVLRQAQATRHRERIAAETTELNTAKKRLEEVETALKSEPAPVDPVRAVLVQTKGDLMRRIKQLEGEIEHATYFTPAAPQAFAVHDVARPIDMRITIRGNAHALGESVPRGFPQLLSLGNAPKISAGTSGRLQLAEWIADPRHPLTSRVAVNRIWNKLFGAGLVRTVDYFGLPGDKPTHPELLDHLALQFSNEGWSHKRLIRELVLSRAYRQASVVANGVRGTRSAEDDPDSALRAPRSALTADPDNRLFGRMNRRRLDAESVRDSLLLVSGKLLDGSHGPPLPLEYRENTGNLKSKTVNPPSFRFAKFRPEQEFERTVYLPVIRSAPQPGPAEVRNVFDFTQPAEFTAERAVTAVPTQALFLMNSDLVKARARDLAGRLIADESDEAKRLDAAWLRVFGRPIAPDERSDAEAFLHGEPGASATGGSGEQATADAELHRWTELCRVLLASNEFLMRM
jgi:hypothetical protein